MVAWYQRAVRSMTGYGRGMAEHADRRAFVEIRSVNHRFLDLKIRGGPLDPAVEEKVATRVKQTVERGSVTVVVRCERGGAAAAVRVDQSAARRIHRELCALAEALRMPASQVTLELLCAQPGVLVTDEVADEPEAVAEVVLAAVEQALATLLRMRESEGATLADDVARRLARLLALVDQVDAAARPAPKEARRRLEERIGRLVAGSKVVVEEARIAQEVAMLADRLDVTEELVRLRSHAEQVASIMSERGAVGRRLDFLVQEMGREFNTVASKSQSSEIARAVVEAKAELEKVREQVQNIE
jgi:uncharacterized protein (TIGR00255 family)